MLLLLLGGLLDGLFLGSTGAIRAQDADVFVYSASARDSFLRSRVTPELRQAVERVDGVRRAGGLGTALVGAAVPGEKELADVAVLGYELAPQGVPDPPRPGTAYADRRLEAAGVHRGDTLLVGRGRSEVRVVGWVEDTSYLLQGSLWVAPETWREIQAATRPDAVLGADTFQVLLVQGEQGVDAQTLADRIDAATRGATSSLTRDQAVLSLPGTKEQNSTFRAIIGVTFFVAGLVVALFFALLTLERTGLYGVLKAVGATSRTLFAGVAAQAVAVAAVAFAAGSVLTFALASFVPPAVPLRLVPARAVVVAVGLVLMAVLGAAVSLRRITRIDPASAIGRAS